MARLQPVSFYCLCVGFVESRSVIWQLADSAWEQLARQITFTRQKSTQACCPPQ